MAGNVGTDVQLTAGGGHRLGEHGFDCDARPSFDASSARIARTRTLALFRKFIG
jgi:dienelactone hydrolase